MLQSCNNSQFHLFGYQSKLKVIEEQDHQKCVSQGLDYDRWGDVITEMYWRCRYNLITSRKTNYINSAEATENNAAIQKISEEILKNLNRTKNSFSKIENNTELVDHKKCDDKNPALVLDKSNNNYNPCQKILIGSKALDGQKYVDPKNLPSSDKYSPNNYSGINIAEANLVSEAIKKYPNCSTLNIKSDDFKKCSEATDKSKECLANIDSLQVKKDLQDKIHCQQQAFIQFPDNYALEKEKSAGEVEKLKLAKKNQGDEEVSKENNNTITYLESDKNIHNIGRYVEDIDNKEEQSKNRLYSRIELLKLRERFIFQCDKKMRDKLLEFSKQSAQDCVDISSNWNKQ